MSLREPVIMTKKEWQDYHDEPLHITASVTAILSGDHEFETPYSEYHKRKQKMLGMPFPEPDEYHIPFLMGHAVEPVTALLLSLEYPGVRIEDPGPYTMWIDPDNEWLGVTPDRLSTEVASGIEGAVELKYTGPFTPDASLWRADEIPNHVTIQNLTQMMVMGVKFGYVAAMVGYQFFHHPTEWIEGADAPIMESVHKFRDMLIKGEEPEPGASLIDTKTIKKLHPKDNGETVELSEDACEAAEKMALCAESIKGLTEEKQGYQNRIMAEIGDNTYGKRGGVKFAWKTQDRKEFTVKATTTRVLRREKVKS